jgi:PAS domain S-box-containing protein
VADDAEREVSIVKLVPAEERLGLLIDAVSEYAIFLLDAEGIVQTWNAGARRIKGYTDDEIVGRSFTAFYTAEDVAAGRPERALATATETGQCRDEGWRVRKDGSTFWANVTITALRDGDGQLIGFAKVTRDETDRKQADEQLRQIELLTDRERIAGELHDVVVHRVFDAGLILEATLRLVRDEAAVARIHEAITMLDDTLKEIRTIVIGLESSESDPR